MSKELRRLAMAATPGPWTVWPEPTPTVQDAIAEFAYQVSNTPCFSGTTWLLNANGLCPASTGCGATSEANAAYIAAASPDVVLSLLDENERLREALRLAEGRLALVLRVFPGAKADCDHPVATTHVLREVRAALSPKGDSDE